MDYFDLYKGKIRLLRKNIEIDEINDLIKNLSDDEALAIVLYITLMYGRTDDNPLKDLPEKERVPEAKLAAFGSSDFDIYSVYDDAAVSLAIAGFRAANKDPLQHDIDVYDKKLFEFIEMLEDSETDPVIVKNIHEVTGKVSFSTNIDIITTLLENSLNVITDKLILISMQQSGKYGHRLRGKLSKKKQAKLLNKLTDDTV